MNQNIKAFFFALLGITLIAAFLITFKQTKLARILRIQVSREGILERAEKERQASVLADEQLNRHINIRLDRDMLRFAQTDLELRHANRISIGRWSVSWQGKPSGTGQEKKAPHFSVSYDFQGRLVGLDCEAPKSVDTTGLAENAALLQAKRFLKSNQIDTTGLQLRKNTVSQEDKILIYKFEFARPSPVSSRLTDHFAVDITGNLITKLNRTTKFASTAEKPESDFDETFKIMLIVVTALLWAGLAFYTIINFIRRLRRDELDLHRAKWVSVALFIAMAGLVALSAYPEWIGMLIGGVLSGLFVSAGALVAYATAEARTREIWPEKILTSDLLFRGYVRVQEIGALLLNVIWLAGVSLLLLALTYLLADKFSFTFLQLSSEELDILTGNTKIITAYAGEFLRIFFVSTVICAIWASYLRTRLRNAVHFLLALGMSLLFSGLFFGHVMPSYIGLLLSLPLAFFWAYLIYKQDVITVFGTLSLVYFFSALALYNLQPHGMSSLFGISAIVLLFGLTSAGLVLLRSEQHAKDFEDYVPEYVNRIAERERLLKELEIARRIQLQFLPQSDPQFTNLDICSICQPAMEVGGDYFDFIQDGDRYFSVVIGDVSGKGVSAAFYMTMAKGIIKTVARKLRAPRLVLSEMNAVFYENSPKEVFISAIYGLFDMQARTLTFARAGHNPLIMRKTFAGAPEFLHPRGLAVGLESGKIFASTIEETTIPVDPGDVFVFYTDGLSEAMNKHGEEFGEERLRVLISEKAGLPAAGLLHIVKDAVFSFAGDAKQHDDFTMVVVKVTGPAGAVAAADTTRARREA